MLVLAATASTALLGLALPLEPGWRALPRPSPLAPPRPRFTPRLPRPPRRAPLAEHGWESRVLCNLTNVP